MPNDSEAKQTEQKQSWKILLASIRKRPGMYIGSPNLQALHMFQQGFRFAEAVYDVPEKLYQEVNDFAWEAFEEYVSHHHNKSRLSVRSFGLAQYVAQGKNIKTFDASEEYEGAWEIWWKWFDEFCESIRDTKRETQA